MLTFSGLTLRRGTKPLFIQANFSVHVGQRVGLTGANGSGKSSLFALILDELHADEGDFNRPASWVIAHVKQETPSADVSILDYTLQGDREYIQLQQAMEHASEEELARLHDQFDVIDGYTASTRAARLLNGLGFKPEDTDRIVTTFSGGWRMRLNLAQALMCRSDLLLLDEPTNHLDLETVVWLQSWLTRYQGTLLVISHDREFLDAVTTHTAHIEHEKLKLYSGNYTAFEKVRAEQLVQQQAQFEKQQKESAHIQSFIDRFKAKATKAKQAQSRIKALQRMQLSAPVMAQSPFSFSFREPDKLPDRLIHAEGVSLGYDELTLLRHIRLQIMAGDRVGLIGANGAGKSTLIKYLAGELQAQAGESWQAQTLKTGYFAQHQLEQLHKEQSPIQHLRALDRSAREQELRNFLGGFGFHGERVDTEIKLFSGGEKSRLVLALLVYQKPNLLLLDEPTNHLDLDMRQALSLALQAFTGAMVIVSHDRYLLKTVADKLILVDDGKVEAFEGDLDDYAQWSLKRIKQQENDDSSQHNNDTQSPAGTTKAVNKKELRQQQAALRKQLQPFKQKADQWEKELAALENKKQALETSMADPALYESDQKERLKSLIAEKQRLDEAIETTEMAWLEASEQYEQALSELEDNV